MKGKIVTTRGVKPATHVVNCNSCDETRKTIMIQSTGKYTKNIECVQCGATCEDSVAENLGWMVADYNNEYNVGFGSYTGEIEKHGDGEQENADEELYMLTILAAQSAGELKISDTPGSRDTWLWLCPECHQSKANAR